jgi:hypothetical protein
VDDISAIKGLLEFLERTWLRPIGLVAAFAVLLIVCAVSSTFLPKILIEIAASIFSIIILISWVKTSRLPRCPSNKVGFVIAIACDTEEIRKIFRSDFVQHLKNLLSEGESADRFWVHEVSHLRNIDVSTLKDATDLRDKMHAAFVLFGQVRSRGRSGQQQHIVDLRGLVSHTRLNEKSQKQLEREFTELLPRRLVTEAGAELPGFELGSSLAELAARYIIGIASECSGDFDYATKLFADAEKRARDLSAAASPAANKILERIPVRLSEIEIARARYAYNAWRVSKDELDLDAVYSFLMSAPNHAQSMGEWLTLMAIYEVFRNADYQKARGLLSAVRSNDAVSKMNFAFLDSIGKNLRSAVKNYRAACKIGVALDTAEEVMDFLDMYRERRPEFYAEISFDLGFVAYSVLGDRHLAQQYFNDFEDADSARRYVEQIKLVPKWLDELTP